MLQSRLKFYCSIGRALKHLQLERPVKKQQIKSQYYKLAKLYHPDANPGSQSAIKKFHQIANSYKQLQNLSENELNKTQEQSTSNFRPTSQRPHQQNYDDYFQNEYREARKRAYSSRYNKKTAQQEDNIFGEDYPYQKIHVKGPYGGAPNDSIIHGRKYTYNVWVSQFYFFFAFVGLMFLHWCYVVKKSNDQFKKQRQDLQRYQRLQSLQNDEDQIYSNFNTHDKFQNVYQNEQEQYKKFKNRRKFRYIQAQNGILYQDNQPIIYRRV